MGKNKLKKFDDLQGYPHVFQYPFGLLQEKGFEMRGKWGETFFKNDNPIVLELGCGKGEYAVGLARRFPQKELHRGRHQGGPHVERGQTGARGGDPERGLPADEHRADRPLLRPGRGVGNLDYLPRPADEEGAQAAHLDPLHGALPADSHPRRAHPPEERQPLPVHLHLRNGEGQRLPRAGGYRRPLPLGHWPTTFSRSRPSTSSSGSSGA